MQSKPRKLRGIDEIDEGDVAYRRDRGVQRAVRCNVVLGTVELGIMNICGISNINQINRPESTARQFQTKKDR